MSWLAAVHESGHAACAMLLGATVGSGPVSIQPTGAYDALCLAGRAPRYRDSDLSSLGMPYVLLPSRLRRYWESQCMIYLAGQIAEERYVVRCDPEPAPEPEPELASVPVEKFPLPAREQAQLDRAAACSEIRTDMGEALKIAMVLHFDDAGLAERHVAFLQRETERLMSGERAGRMVLALARELMAARTLSARQWRAVLLEAA